MSTKSLRHRNLDSPAGKNTTPTNNNKFKNHMAYTRRNIATPFSRSGSNLALPNNNRNLTSYRKKFFIILAITSLYTAFLYRQGGASTFLGPATIEAKSAMSAMIAAGRKLSVTTWNIAAINNNPFEYWITYKENPEYEKLMINIENFLENPGDKDIPVQDVFTEEMFAKLDKRLTGVGWKSVRSYWENDFRNRKIVSGFLKDTSLGSKRLASMPDRMTNTINVETKEGQVFRPTVINMYAGDLSTLDKWWKAWEKFMFDDKLKVKGKKGVEKKIPYQMLQKIKKSKYPDITEEEEADSLPLQTMCGAIFDAILVHMMNTVTTSPSVWQDLKKTMVENLNKKKVPHTLDILKNSYGDTDIITLQEVSSSFIDMARASKLGKTYHIVAPADLDPDRDQNSVIFLKKELFPHGPGKEITKLVEEAFPEGKSVPVAKGDILAITATNKFGLALVVASFHGDTNGLATKPVVDATVKAMQLEPSLQDHKLVFGMDANTYEHATSKQQDVTEFAEDYISHGLTSCWGDLPNPSNYTTYNARTYLQPQLNKACKSTEKRQKGDVNPKDFIVFPKSNFAVIKTWKDNTGRKEYIEDMAFPTLEFPSDHGLLSTILDPLA